MSSLGTLSPEALLERRTLCGPLLGLLREHLRAKAANRDARELAAALAGLHATGWIAEDSQRTLILADANPQDQKDLVRLMERIEAPLREAVLDPARPLPRTMAAAVRLGERVASMHMARVRESLAAPAALLTERLAHTAYLGAALRHSAIQAGVPEGDLAPAFFAALTSFAYPADCPTPEAALEKYGLASGSPHPHSTHAAWANTLLADFVMAKYRAVDPVRLGDRFGRELFQAQPPAHNAKNPAERLSPFMKALIKADDPGDRRPRVHVSDPVNFGAKPFGVDDVERAESADRLLKTIISERAEIDASINSIAGKRTRSELLIASITHLEALEQHAKAERDIRRRLDAEWEKIKTEMQRTQERKPDEPVIYTLPETMPAPMARALYYDEAARSGVPAGVLLHELAHDNDLTFGPGERTFFTRVILGSARLFASNLAAQKDQDPRLALLAADDEFHAETIALPLHAIERGLRRAAERLPTDELVAMGNARVQALLDAGEMSRDEYELLMNSYDADQVGGRSGSIVDAMVARALADTELLSLTSALVAEGLTEDALSVADQLPYARYAARQDAAQTTLKMIPSRTGKILEELERHTRARWTQYRSAAPLGTDAERAAGFQSPTALLDGRTDLRNQPPTPAGPPGRPGQQRPGGPGPRPFR